MKTSGAWCASKGLGDEEMARLPIAGANPNIKDKCGCSVLTFGAGVRLYRGCHSLAAGLRHYSDETRNHPPLMGAAVRSHAAVNGSRAPSRNEFRGKARVGQHPAGSSSRHKGAS